MKTQNIFRKAIAVVFIAALGLAQADAQVVDITFSRPLTGDSNLSSIDVGFGQTDQTRVQIDQLGSGDALFVNNDSFGQEVLVEAMGPIDSIGVVSLGDVLTAGTDFGSTSLDLEDDLGLQPGDDFFLGFRNASTGDVGYVNVAWSGVLNGPITFALGEYATNGVSVEVGAVPEPAAVAMLAAFGVGLLARRRRAV